MALAFTPGQKQFAGTLSHLTGLGPRVIASWLYAEQNGPAAQGYQNRGYNNWLNIANTDSGPASGAHSPVWGNPNSAARATAEWLKGEGRIAHEYGAPAPGIRAILNTAGKSPQAQIQAIANSGWASSGYNGGATLRSILGQLGGLNLPAGSGGGSPQSGGQGPREASIHGSQGESGALAALVAQLSQPPGSGVEGFTVPKVEGEATGPKAPAPLAQPESQSTALIQALAALSEGKGPEAKLNPAQKSTAEGGEPKGLAKFGGKEVAGWIAPALEYAKAHGWHGSVTSGFRSRAEQERIYNSGVRPAAVPGTSNHEGSEYPRGAVDVTESQQLAQILSHSPYAGKLVWAGSKDPVHFSHPHGGKY